MSERCPRKVAVALVHHPVLGREGGVITTAVTNLDVHDISRSARTYGLERVYIVHPVEVQRELVAKIRGHWTDGAGARRIPDRADALGLIEPIPTLDDALSALTALGGGERAEVWTTAAQARGEVSSYAQARARLWAPGPPVMLVFGTGWGLPAAILDDASLRLEPIAGVSGWNHLSVRAACAISLDRLIGLSADTGKGIFGPR